MCMFSFGKKWHPVLSFNIMQKEDLIKRLRLFAAITTTLFVIMVVALLVQFGFIANYHKEIRDLKENNNQLQQEIENLQKDVAYYGANGEGPKDEGIRNAGAQQN